MFVTLVVGLPGSGKTCWARDYAQQYNAHLLDDPRCVQDFDQVPSDTKHLVITDPSLCNAEHRERVPFFLEQKFGPICLQWVFFENDPEQCLLNSSGRQNKPVEASIRMWSKIYSIPTEAWIEPVWREQVNPKVI